MNKPLDYIAIEGPIGVGKTTLAELLAEELRYRPFFEEAQSNPFLPDFYESRSQYALQTQLFFLLARLEQEEELSGQNLENQAIISDYLFSKDEIFAPLNLSLQELALYRSIRRRLEKESLKPDLVIFLQAEPKILKERIKSRRIEFEQKIDLDYLEELVQAYNQYFFSYEETPLLVVNCSAINFSENSEDYKNLLHEILEMRKQGFKRHYVTISTEE